MGILSKFVDIFTSKESKFKENYIYRYFFLIDFKIKLFSKIFLFGFIWILDFFIKG